MKILCLGNNSQDTANKVDGLAKQNNLLVHGLITQKGFIPTLSGFYHTTVIDVPYGDLIALGAKFDKILVLDQPLADWEHLDSYYLTVSAARQLENTVSVEWQNKKSAESIFYFSELVAKNKSFCIFPFIELLTIRGHTTVCCRSSKPITTVDNLTDWQSNKDYNAIRQNMLDGVLVPDHCSTCYNLENLGIKSARQQETVEWANRLQLRSINDLKNISTPVYYEVRPSNICNLQCRTCGPDSSEKIREEYIQLKLHNPLIEYENKGFEYVSFNNLKKLYVSGGEPTAMPEFYQFLKKCIDQQQTNFELLVNTNAAKISNKLFDLFKNFKQLGFVVSIDGLQELNDYIRWPSNWQSIIDNVNRLKSNGHFISFNVTVSIYNIAKLGDLFVFFDKNFPGHLVHCNLADQGWYSPFVYPDSIEVIESLTTCQSTACYKNDQLLKDFIDPLVHQFNNSYKFDQTKLEKFFKLNDLLDGSRGTKLNDYLPKLERFKICQN